MKIVIIGTRGFPNVQGGVEKHCENLAVNLVKIGCDVTVFTRRPYVDTSIKEFKGVKLISLPAIKCKHLETFLHTLIGIFAAVSNRPDILHIQAIGPAMFTPLARMLGIRVLVTSHGSNYKHLKWGRFAKLVLRVSEFLAIKFANEIIAISPVIAKEIKDKYGRSAIFIPNGVNIYNSLTTIDFLKKFGLEGEKYILTVGRIVPEKGFHDLIEAFNKTDYPGLKLVIVGQADHEGKYSLSLKEQASKNNNVILTGLLAGKALRELYSHAGLFVLPSYYEGLSLALLEAMSHGLSCIVSDIPANRNIEIHKYRFFKPGDVKNLSEKIKEFIGRPMREEEKLAQIKLITGKYNWEDIAKRTMEVYEKIAN